MALSGTWTQLAIELSSLSQHLHDFVASNPPQQLTFKDECFLEGLLSRVWQVWCIFCRSCVIKSCIGTVAHSGTIIPALPEAMSEAHVSAAAIHAAKKHRNNLQWADCNTSLRKEPTWGDVDILVEILTRLQPSNSNQLLAAFSSSYTSAKALQTIRNAAAHNHSQNLDEILKLRSAYIASEIGHPTHALFWIEPNSSDYLVMHAIHDLTEAGFSAIQ